MIDEFLKWLGFDRSPSSPLRGHRPARDCGRRLLVEPMEDRLLLSVTYMETVSEGGTVALPSMRLSGGLQSSVTFPGFDSSDFGTVDGFSSTAVVQGLPSGDLPTSSDSLFTEENDSFSVESLPGERASAELAGPKNIELTPDVFNFRPSERGMVSVSVRHDVVFEMVGAGVATSEKDGLLNLQPSPENDSSDLFPTDQVAGRDRPGDALKSLSGSRGRLAAFDLAMQQETSFHWRAVAEEDANLNAPAIAAPSSPARTGSAPTQHAPLDSFSSLHRAPTETPAQTGEAASPATSLDRRPASSRPSFASLHSPRQKTPESQSVAYFTSVWQDKTRAGDAVAQAAVHFGHSSEKTATHLVLAIGAAHAITYLREQPTDNPEHVQLPPRRR